VPNPSALVSPTEPTPANLCDTEQARLHLSLLFPETLVRGERIEMRPRAPQTGDIEQRGFYDSIDAVITAAMRLRQTHDVFFGIGSRRCGDLLAPTMCRVHRAGGKDHVYRLGAAWTDLDIATETQPDKPHSSREAAIDLLAASVRPPNMLVTSGHGLHAYWTIRPVAIGREALQQIENVNRALVSQFKGGSCRFGCWGR